VFMNRAGFRTSLIGLLSLFTAGAATMTATSAHAQSDYSYRYDRQQFRHEGQKIAYDKGYRTGLDRGDDDVRHHRSPDPDRSSHYRNADDGYHREYGPKEEYRESYRDGFRQGYSEAYRRYRRY